MTRVLMGGTAAIALALAAGHATAQTAIEALLAAVPEIQASGYEVRMDGRDEIVTGLRFVAIARPDEGAVTIDRIVFSDVGEQAPGALLPSLGGVSIEGLLFDSGLREDGYVTIERVAASGADFPGLLAIAYGLAPPDPAVLGNLGSFVLENLRGEIVSQEQVFSLGLLSVQQVDDLRVGSFRVEDFHLDSTGGWNPVQVRIAHMEGTDIDMAAVLQAADARPSDMGELLARFPLTSFSMSGIEADTPSGPFSIAGISIDGVRVEDGVTTAATTRVEGFVLPVDMLEDRDAIRLFNGAGLEQLTLDFAAGYDIDTAGRTAVLDPLRLAVAEVVAIDMRLALSSVPVEALGAFDSITEEQAAAVAIDHLRFTIEDLGMIAIVLDAGERETGQSREALIMQAVGGLQFGLGMLGGVPALADAPQTVDRFIRNSGRLTLELAPAAPVSIMMTVFSAMANPAGAIGLLAPSLRHE